VSTASCALREIRYCTYSSSAVKTSASTAVPMTAGTTAAVDGNRVPPNGRTTRNTNTPRPSAHRPATRSPSEAGAVAMFSIARTSNAIASTFRACAATPIVRRANATQSAR
jgi:hypothetical protein